jgi:hypothetical protein
MKRHDTHGNAPPRAGHAQATRANEHDLIDHDRRLLLSVMSLRSAVSVCVAWSAGFVLNTLAVGLVGAQQASQQTHLGAGALYEASRQVAAEQARRAETDAIAQARRSLPPVAAGPDPLPPGLPGVSGLRSGLRDDPPFGTGYEKRMARAAAAAGLAVGSPSRPAVAGAAAGGAGAAAHAGGQGGRGRR